MRLAERQREEDAAFFEDWSCGRDRFGLWLWPDPQWRAIVVRPYGTDMVHMVSRLGGERQAAHRYDDWRRRDWLIPAANWRRVKAAIPELIALRTNYMRREGC